MANNKFYGYTPDPSKEKEGNRLDYLNPYEFKKGMDYELVELGIARLQESTLEERMKTTEKVIQNLTYHPSYYSGLIHYETQYRNAKTKPAFKSWLKDFHEETAMKPASTKDKLKEAIKKQIKKTLLKEQSDDFEDFDMDDKSTTKLASKAGSKKGKGVKALDKEAEKLNKEKDTLKDKMFPLIQAFKAKKKGRKKYGKEDYEDDLKKIKTSDKSPVATDKGNDHVTDRIKAINKRLEDIEKEKEDILLKEKMDKREVAATMMDRTIHKELLNIIKEAGISLREGSDYVKPYYEIAKMSYMEGLTAGIRQ
tara:strand:- start:468 stop:1397 length:930 start_codon:yes stop_codon:yes gene_type:complete